MPASEVLEDRTGSDANPALLCYVRKDRDLVDTLHREILEVEALLGDEEIEEPVERPDVTVQPAESVDAGPFGEDVKAVGQAEHVEHVEDVQSKAAPMEIVAEGQQKAI